VKVLSRLLLAPTLAAVLLLACTPTNAARRISGSPYDGTWSVAIYTLRGDCSSVRVAARIVGGRVYSKDQSYQANGAVGANGVIRVSVASGRQSLMVTRRAKPPSPSPSITRRRTPAAPSGWGSFFSGHRRRRGRIRAAKNEFCRPPSSGLRTCTIRDEDLMVPVIEGEGSGRSA
jgi:hypothetical protein